jgi:hypothetical protein
MLLKIDGFAHQPKKFFNVNHVILGKELTLDMINRIIIQRHDKITHVILIANIDFEHILRLQKFDQLIQCYFI